MNTLTKSLIIILFFFGSFNIYGQGVGLWSSLSLDKKVTKKTNASLNFQTRFNDNLSYLQTYLIESGLAYKIAKGLDVSFNYRFSNRRKNIEKAFVNRHRFFVDASYARKFKFLKVDYRARYQHQFKDNDGTVEFDVNYLRNKIELSLLNKSKMTPYISGDLFYQIGYKFDQIRPKVGFSYKINKIQSIDLGIFSNIDIIDPLKPTPIIAIEYKFKLK